MNITLHAVCIAASAGILFYLSYINMSPLILAAALFVLAFL